MWLDFGQQNSVKNHVNALRAIQNPTRGEKCKQRNR